MYAKLSNIYAAANKCGFAVKHKANKQDIVLAFKDKDSDLRLFFEVRAKNDKNEKTFCENVSHAVFMLSENIDPHTETRKYLEKIGGTLQEYTEIYSQINDISWKVRKLWLSL